MTISHVAMKHKKEGRCLAKIRENHPKKMGSLEEKGVIQASHYVVNSTMILGNMKFFLIQKGRVAEI